MSAQYVIRQSHPGSGCRHYLRATWTGWNYPRFGWTEGYVQREALRLGRRDAVRLLRGFRQQGDVVTLVRLVPKETTHAHR